MCIGLTPLVLKREKSMKSKLTILCENSVGVPFGVINIIAYALAQMKTDRIHAIIGGTHLGFSSDEQFEETVKELDRYQIDLLGVSHCTGLARASMLHAKLKERFFFGTVGSTIEA